VVSVAVVVNPAAVMAAVVSAIHTTDVVMMYTRFLQDASNSFF
jgi:hypothetical protein